jgi:hypothetical protein
MEWISVEDALPVIPEGNYGIQVIAAVFDKIYEEINPGNGYSVYQISFHKISDEDRRKWGWRKDITEDFMERYEGTEVEYGPVMDEVTHWCYMPEPPKYAG